MMKKITALILVTVFCLFAVTACGGSDEVDAVGAMFKASKPTKIVTTTTQTFGDTVLEGEYVLRTGLVDGLAASVYLAAYEELVSVEEGGATDVVVDSIVLREEMLEYREGRGVRKAGGSWKKNEENFASEVGPMSLEISGDYIKSYTYEDHRLECAVAAKNTAEVLGLEEDLAVDVSLTLVDDGASITDIVISYTIPADTAAQVPETTVTITAKYTYDLEKIVIE